MAVDTHVFRVSHRIGLVPQTCTTPLATEKYLMKYIPKEIVPTAHHWLIYTEDMFVWHGHRNVRNAG